MADEIPRGGVHNLVIPQGGSFTRTFASRRPDLTTVVPLTGYSTGFAQIRDEAGGRELLAEFDVEVDEDAGTVTISLDATATAAMTKSGVYDIALVHENGVDRILPFVEGKATLDTRVTVVGSP